MADRDTGTAFMTPAQMLAMHERFMSGAEMADDEKQASRQIQLAAAFGAQAMERYPFCDGGAVNALLRAFLLALVDDLHPDLDYLRMSPEAGATARAERAAKEVAHG